MRSGWNLFALALLFSLAWTPASGAGEPAGPDLHGEETFQQREARMAWWREAKFGLFVHWGPVSLTGKELSWSRQGPRPSDHQALQEIRQAEYDSLYKRFNPTEFSAKEWVEIAKAAGMKYLVFTTKHHDGFSNFHTRFSDYNIAKSPFHRDIVKELADACHQGGMRFGVYYSTRDWYHPDYLRGDNSKYNEFFHGQIRELLGNYGKVDILWFDHVGGNWRDWRFPELHAMIRQLQPEIVINNRGAAFVHRPTDNPTPEITRLVRGDFDTPEQQLGRFSTDRAWESCITLVGGQWAYKPEGKMYTLPECIGMLVQCVTGDGNLLLNVGPMPSGKIEPRQVERLTEIGQWLRQYGESIYGTRGGPWSNGPWGGSTRKGNTVYVHVLRWDGDSLKLPPLAHKIVGHRMLTGGHARIEQTAQGVAISVPTTQRHTIDTIVALELDAPPGLSVLSPLDYQVFQRNTRLAGQVLVRGGVRGDCDSVRVRLIGKPLEGKLDEQWQTVSLNPKTRQFQGHLALPAGGWYRLELQAVSRGMPGAMAAVEHVGVGEVFVVAGQSNSTNYGSERQRTATGMVSSFDGSVWRIADDPQRGVQDGSSGGSFLPAFGDALVAKYQVPVGVASVGCGATSVRQWLKKGEKIEVLPTLTAFVKTVGPNQWEAEGTLFDGLMKRINQLGPHGLRAVLWHQGESDAGQARAGYPADRQITGEQYRRYMERLILACQAQAGWKIPWLTAQATYHGPKDPSDAEFRQAQKWLWETGIALQGPDTDALNEPYRDGVHFNGKGLQAHGRMWAEKVGAYLDRWLK